MLIGTEIKEGEKVPEKNQATATSGFLAVQTGHQGDQEIVHWKEGDPLTAGKLFVVKVKRKYRKLHVGDKIEKGQLIAILDSTVQISDVGAKFPNWTRPSPNGGRRLRPRKRRFLGTKGYGTVWTQRQRVHLRGVRIAPFAQPRPLH